MPTIRTVAVIGAGAAGRAFALRAAQAGFSVVLEDVMPAKLRHAQNEFAALAPSGPVDLRYAGTVEEAVRGADLAIDFVPDELESKLEIFSMLDRMAPPRTILLTPTRTLSITDLASCTYRPSLCVGIRSTTAPTSPQSPDLLTPPLELIRSRFADETILTSVSDFLTALSLPPQIMDDREEPMLVKNASS